MIKKLIKNLIRSFGYNIQKIPKEVNEISINEILGLTLPSNSVIFDVGANQGQSIKNFKNIFPDSKIYAFEPSKEDFEILKKKYHGDQNIVLNNIALGDKKENKLFNVMHKSDTSSFLNLNKNSEWLKYRSKSLKIPEEDYIKNTSMVEVDTIDNYLKTQKIDKINCLKIDTQGYEDKVLMGCLESLKNNTIDVVVAEIIFDNVYDKYLTFLDLEKHLVTNNYRMAGINLTNNNIFRGLVFFADVIYINKNILKNTN